MSSFFTGFGDELLKLAVSGTDLGIPGSNPFGKKPQKPQTQKSLDIPPSNPFGGSDKPKPLAQQGGGGGLGGTSGVANTRQAQQNTKIRNPGLASQVQRSRSLGGAGQGQGPVGQKAPPAAAGGPSSSGVAPSQPPGAPVKPAAAPGAGAPAVKPVSAPAAAAGGGGKKLDINKQNAALFGGGGGSPVPKKFDVF